MPMNALVLLLALTSVLVLRSGDRIAVEGAVREENGVVTFRSGGVVYSMPSTEVERIEKQDARDGDGKKVRRLAVTPEERKRLIAELEKNHGGTPPPKQATLEKAPDPPSRHEQERERREEAQWRREARAHEEAVTRAREELALLEERAQELQSQIHSFVSLGYKPNQFTYQTTRLARTLEQIPYARLELERAQRAYDQFREDARRAGVMPGWLR